MTRKEQALVWIWVWAIVTILPFFTWHYFGFVWIILPFAGYILIKHIIDYKRGKYG